MGCVRGWGGRPLVQDTLETTKKTECNKIYLLRISFHFFFNTYRTYSMHVVRAIRCHGYKTQSVLTHVCMFTHAYELGNFPFSELNN